MRTVVITLLAVAAHAQELRLPALFSDHMVMQRDRDAAVWGWAPAGAEVRVTSSWGERATARSGDDGRWRAKLKTGGAAEGQSMTVTCGDLSRTINHVALGDVWLCSGQSNMEWNVNQTRPAGLSDEKFFASIGPTELPRLRLFTVGNAVATSPRQDVNGQWVPSTREAVRQFSACGFYFGRKIHDEVGVPVGLIAADWGGTVCESWTSRGSLEKLTDFDDGLARVAEMDRDASKGDNAFRKALARWWQKIGDDLTWTGRDFDGASWDKLTAPGVWEGHQIGEFDGVVFMRKVVQLPDSWAGKELSLDLGPIDDMDTTWFNGQRVGGMERPGSWNVPRRYVVPADLVKAGANVIAVRCVDTGGAGGFAGAPDAMRLRQGGDGTQSVSLAGHWQAKKGASRDKLPPFPPSQRLGPNMPTALHNGMIAPLVPFGLKGFLWYQGESNRGRGFQYRTLFKTMIQDWRALFGQGDLPFYFVQIAPFLYGNDAGQAAELREAQMMTMKLKNTGMACTMDIGNPRDIHPKNKKEVGHRLARWALNRDYGKGDVVVSGPVYQGMKTEGDAIRVRFTHGQGLNARGGAPSHFQIAAEDGVFVPASARIDGETVVVSSPRIKAPAAVRYAWGAADEPNLFNGAGLPASSFRTDDLPRSIRRRYRLGQ